MYESAKKARNFLNECSNEKLTCQIPILLSHKMKISVVVPAFNAQNTIKRTIHSIQNQNMEEIDIIIINDFSSDNTSYIIDDLKSEDKRIRIINNKKNMGTLYSRCIGTLASKGKYIFPLDSDDMILDKDVLNNIYNLMEKKKLDITVFKSIKVNNFKDIFKLNNLRELRSTINKYITYRQPELINFATIVLWGQCIKAYIYKKSINIYGKKRYSIYMNYYEDAIINHIIYQTSESCTLLPYYAILYISRKGSICRSTTKIKEKFAILKHIETMLEFSRNNNKIKNSITSKIINIFKNANFNKYMHNTKFKSALKITIKKIFSSKYLSSLNKENIKHNISNFYQTKKGKRVFSVKSASPP